MAAAKRKKTRKNTARRKTSRRRSPAPFLRRHPWWSVLLALLALLSGYLLFLSWQISSQFEGRRWDLPARVYARPLEIFSGQTLGQAALEQELERLGYRRSNGPPEGPGQFRRHGRAVELITREFRFWDEHQPATAMRVEFSAGQVSRVIVPTGRTPVVRLDPLMVGSIFAAHGEDRLVVQPGQVPPVLRQALIVVEDRRFEQHLGVDPVALVRATLANLRAGAVTQGGSTLTQQLVKNYFLDNRRTLVRKIREALMALVLERHYDKDQILNAYINEIYLGQDGKRAIHGFGLASQFYFSRPLNDLDLHQVALLVALVRGPGYYDPVLRPDRALARRNLVLKMMGDAGVLDPETVAQASARELDIWDRSTAGASYYPAYLALVRQQLSDQYRAEDLTQTGLRIFSALDPLAQASAERHLAAGLAELDQRDTSKKLAGAAVVTSPSSGDVLAIVGDRRAGFDGFNRALQASRPVGSLIKPFVYLAALKSGRYTLASLVDDAEINVPLPNGDIWTPRNFSEEPMGEVTLLRALAESLNMATVRLGMDIGVQAVAETLAQSGHTQAVSAYPSLLLGAIEMTPVQVTQLYSTLANDGFYTPLRAVRSVVNAEGEPLQRYPIEVAEAQSAADVYQLNQGLVAAMERGTGRSAQLPIKVAGKTGTSDEFRDSWFAGFSGDRVVTVWIGHDDYSPTALSGASGALRIWMPIMTDLAQQPFEPVLPRGLAPEWVDYYSGAAVGRQCESGIRLALPPGVELNRNGGCSGGNRGIGERTLQWLNDVLN